MSKQHNKILTALFATVIMAGTAINLAQAGESKDKEAKELQLFSQAKITLSEAINAAEQKTGGKAMEAELDDESATVQFEIEVLKDGKVHEVKVDGKTGKVLKVSLDDESKEGVEKETENEKE
ncbi:PepSY domain-containing protein [Methyloglobulus sp.]|uniref:PepSY domain-containing protein n=1 Tax=Methyloglobulus sp. TaxID=2518622 RepID=UPI003989C0D6